VGIFPPAASGQALVNDSYRELLTSLGARVDVINTSPSPGRFSIRRRLGRFPRAIAGAWRLLQLRRRGLAKSVYVGVSGGYGQVYDVLLLALGRLGGSRLFLHHDSYAYLDKPRLRAKILLIVAGRKAKHIVPCADMAARLRGLYSLRAEIVVISNATNTERPKHAPAQRKKLVTIGLISLLTRAKGVIDFIELAERVCRARPELRAVLAGPIMDSNLEPLLMRRLSDSRTVRYLGPVYGNDKRRFYAELDVLILPTRFMDEAAPKVVTEAIAHGAVVVARGRGCISSVLSRGGGVSIAETEDFVDTAERLLLGWCSDQSSFSIVSDSAIANFNDLYFEHNQRLQKLADEMMG
jgi:glycosyltransferase involved in cell wall biosynthesis